MHVGGWHPALTLLNAWHLGFDAGGVAITKWLLVQQARAAHGPQQSKAGQRGARAKLWGPRRPAVACQHLQAAGMVAGVVAGGTAAARIGHSHTSRFGGSEARHGSWRSFKGGLTVGKATHIYRKRRGRQQQHCLGPGVDPALCADTGRRRSGGRGCLPWRPPTDRAVPRYAH